MATIPNRIKAFADALKVSIRQIEIKTGAANGTFSKAITQNRDIGSGWIEKIVSAYPELNAVWLVTGIGNMWTDQMGQLREQNKLMEGLKADVYPRSKSSPETIPKTIPIPIPKGKKGQEMTVVNEPQVTLYGAKSRSIPILDARAAAGWPYTIDGTGFLDLQPTISLPYGWFQTGEYVLIQIEGDSMHPTIYNGDWVFIRKIDILTDIKDGYVHVVLTRDGIVCKRLLNRVNKGHMALQSDNSAYPTYTVPLDEIISIWRVEMKMSAILRNENLDIIKRISGMEADIAELKAKKKG